VLGRVDGLGMHSNGDRDSSQLMIDSLG
jgi:hypothetical protein